MLVGLERIRHILAASLRTRILLLMLGAFVVVGVPGYFAFVTIVNETVVKLGTLFAEKQILFDRYRGLGALMQEVTLAETLSRSEAVRDWALDEDDPRKTSRGIAELEHFRRAFSDHSYFFVVGASGNYYFNNAANTYAGRQFSHTLSPDNPRDGWYYQTAALGEGCHLNVDHDDVLRVTKVWINCVIEEGGRVLGVLGSGIDLTAFIREVVDIPQTGVTAMFVDRTGAVQAHRDARLVDFHSLTKDLDSKKTVFSLIDREEDRAAMRRMMAEVTSEEVRVSSQFMQVGGREMLVGVGYLDRLGWYNITLMDIEKVVDRGLFLPIGLLLAVLMLLSLAMVGYVFKRSVLDRLRRVENQFAAVRGGKFAPVAIDQHADEIGRLSRRFAAMAAALSDNTQMLEQMVEVRTEALRDLAYRDQLTGIANRRGFIEAYRAAQENSGERRRALLLIDIDAFKLINDTLGHKAGDAVVRETARRLAQLVRPADICGRWGGDEFILLVDSIGEVGLAPIAEGVKAALTEREIVLPDGRSVGITVSIGASELDPGDTIDAACEMADAALYRAKDEGRNRVRAFSHPPRSRTA